MKILNEKIDRRKFIKIAGTGLTLFAFEGLLRKVNSEEIMPKKGKKRRYAMVIDLRRCIGCEACTIACKVENNIPVDYSDNIGRKIFWNQVIFKEEGEYPYTDRKFWPRPCFHCEKPSCVKVCPVGATYIDQERGLVLQRYERCIGCRYCTVACPYGARYFNWSKPHWPKEMQDTFNPDVEKRYKGIVEKCTFCIHRIKKAEEKAKKENREIKDGEIEPACVLTCMGKARFFGDLNDPESEVSKLVRSGRAYRLEEYLGTEPKVFYLMEG
ncbi:MAG: 4Fe-4S dicluster domain-containing protein [Candidatus Omnitrophica bacterium]|nr:4Fe-4S dicluster domain-containing protein [Candidatus Omnitrophota bacterium]